MCIFKSKSKEIKIFLIYHFLVKGKARERIDLLITASVNIYQTKNSNEKILFWRKTDKKIWYPPTPSF